MPQLINWDLTGARKYETGIDRGVLYVRDANGTYPTGVAWNGLVSITESPSGAEPTPLYADNIKYLTLMSAEEFAMTIEAFTYPEEFGECDGTRDLQIGLYVAQQTRKQFGLCYRSLLGNDVSGNSLGYRLHFAYGCLAAPSEKAYSSINDSPEAITFSWEVSTTPVAVVGFSPTSFVTLDSTLVVPSDLTALEVILYGATPSTQGRMPLPDELKTLMTP